MSDTVFSSLMGRDIAVDLGTANTVVYVRAAASCSTSRRSSP